MKNISRCVATLLLASTFSLPTIAQPAKVGFIYNGAIADAGWNFQHELGRQQMEQALSSKVSVKVISNANEGTDGAKAARELTADGAKMVFAVGFGYMRNVLRIASENRGTCYAVATGYETSANVSGYTAKWYEGGYLAGIVAGKTTKANVIGFVGAYEVPDVMWYLNAFALGARSVNPKANVRAIFVGSWSAPQREVEATRSLINQGVDVMAHFTDSSAVVATADARGIPSISFHSDRRKFAPKHFLTGVTHEWGEYYTRMTSEALAGRCQGSLYVGGVKEGNIKLAPFSSNVPQDVVSLVATKTKEIAEGKLNVLGGPIKDNQGIVRIAPGDALKDSDLQKAFWYVEGVAYLQR